LSSERIPTSSRRASWMCLGPQRKRKKPAVMVLRIPVNCGEKSRYGNGGSRIVRVRILELQRRSSSQLVAAASRVAEIHSYWNLDADEDVVRTPLSDESLKPWSANRFFGSEWSGYIPLPRWTWPLVRPRPPKPIFSPQSPLGPWGWRSGTLRVLDPLRPGR
jgi:hypothetical protein